MLIIDLYFYAEDRSWAVAEAQLPSGPVTSINRWLCDGFKPMIVSSQATMMDD